MTYVNQSAIPGHKLAGAHLKCHYYGQQCVVRHAEARRLRMRPANPKICFLTAILLTLNCSLAMADEQECGSDQKSIAAAKQRIVLLDRVLDRQEKVRFIADHGDPASQQALAEAIDLAGQAHSALDNNCGKLATRYSTRALKSATSAFSGNVSRKQPVLADYEKLERRSSGFLRALAAIPLQEQQLGADDLRNMERQLERSRQLAKDDHLEAAMRLLEPVVDRLERRLAELLENQSIVYSRDFANPSEEYRYEAERVRGYQLLYQMVSKQRSPPHGSEKRLARLWNQGQELTEKGAELARQQEWQEAISALRQATGIYEQMLRTLGIFY
jgi:hypothetical protein